MADNSSLEERIRILEEFIGNTRDIHWFRAMLDHFFLAFDYRGNDGAAKDLKQVKEMFSDDDSKEQGLLVEYGRLMWKGKYASQDGWNYILAMADEIRRMKGLPENAPVNLVEGSAEWEQAAQSVRAKRNQFIAEKIGQVDQDYAYNLLVNAVGLRIRAYEQLVNNRNSLANLMGFARQPYEKSWMSGSEDNQAFLEGSIGEFISYGNMFPNMVNALFSKVPRIELLESRKALPEVAQQPLG